jgi:adenine/guanine/hypoxanthine permease
MEKTNPLHQHINIRTEIIAGITTFLATMYIIVVNPAILQDAGMPYSGVLTATVLVSAFSSIFMGIYARNPIVIAPGMGINAFFAYSVVIGMDVSWPVALGAVFWSGIVFLLLSIFNVRTHIVKAIPRPLRYAVAAGIGLFISYVGFKNAMFIVDNRETLSSLAGMNPITITFVAGLFITSVLVCKKVKGALVVGIIMTTIMAIPIGRLWGDASVDMEGIQTLVTWKGLFAAPDFSLIFSLNLFESLKLSLWPVIFAFLFTDMFDSLSTFIGVSEAANLVDEEGEPRHIKPSLIVDAFATTISGLVGTSAGTAYIESAAGVKEGGRHGLTAIVAGLFFLPFMFLSPLLSVVPSIATAPALILVGVFMMTPILKINWQQYDEAIPAFLAMILIPLANSITQGIIWGFLSWTCLKAVTGKSKEISITLLIIDAFAILALVIS